MSQSSFKRKTFNTKEPIDIDWCWLKMHFKPSLQGPFARSTFARSITSLQGPFHLTVEMCKELYLWAYCSHTEGRHEGVNKTRKVVVWLVEFICCFFVKSFRWERASTSWTWFKRGLIWQFILIKVNYVGRKFVWEMLHFKENGLCLLWRHVHSCP